MNVVLIRPALADEAGIDYETVTLCGECPADRPGTREITEYAEVGNVGNWIVCDADDCAARVVQFIEMCGNTAGDPEPLPPAPAAALALPVAA